MIRQLHIKHFVLFLIFFYTSYGFSQTIFPIKDKFDTINSILIPSKIKSFTPVIEMYQAMNIITEQVDDMLIYNFTEANNMPANSVNDIIKDEKGYLWLATNKGLLKFDGNTFYRIQLPDSLASAEVRALTIDKTGAIWFSVFENALLKYYNNQIYVMNEVALDLEIRELFVASDSTIWVGCDNGFSTLKNNKITKYSLDYKKAHTDSYYAVIDISEDNDKNIWISPFGHNLLIIGKDSTYELSICKVKEKEFHYNKSKSQKTIHQKNGLTLICGRHRSIMIAKKDTLLKSYEEPYIISGSALSFTNFTDIEIWNNSIIIASSLGLLKMNSTYDTATYIKSPSVMNKRCRRFFINDNVLFLSKEDGFSIIYKANTQKKIFPNSVITSLRYNKQTLFLTVNNTLYKRNFDSIIKIADLNATLVSGKIAELTDIYSDKILFISKNKILGIIKGDNNKLPIYYSAQNTHREGFRDILPNGSVNKALILNDSILVSVGHEVIVFLDYINSKVINKIDFPKEITSAEKIVNDNKIVFSTDKKLFVCDIKTLEIKEIFTSTKGIISSFTIDKNDIWIYTSIGTIYRLNSKTFKINKSVESLVMEKYFNTGIKIIQDKVFLTTNGGFFYFNIAEFDVENMHIYKLKLNSINSYNIGFYNIEYIPSKEVIYYSFNDQIYKVSYSELFTPEKITPYIAKIYINEKEYNKSNFMFSSPEITLPHDSSSLKIYFSTLSARFDKVDHYNYILEGYDKSWKEISQINYINYSSLPFGEYTLKYIAVSESGFESPEIIFKIRITPPFWRTYWFYGLSGIITISVFYLFIVYREKHLKAEKLLLEKKVTERTEEVVNQKIEIEKKKNIITDSIEYAKNLQKNILTKESELTANLKNAFVFHKPKDIVSGDFYWVYNNNEKIIIAVVDCIGHGVSGAFVSLVGHMFLNEIIKENPNAYPDQLLQKLNQKTLNIDKSMLSNRDVKYGMDISIISIDKNKLQLRYAGARNPILIIRDRQMNYFEGDKTSIINTNIDFDKQFKLHEFQLLKNDMIYLYTDGYPDQIGGPENKKIFSNTFRTLLQTISPLPLNEQKETLYNILMDWMKNSGQTDDILIVGIRVD